MGKCFPMVDILHMGFPTYEFIDLLLYNANYPWTYLMAKSTREETQFVWWYFEYHRACMDFTITP